jgi:hypothetical protein
MELEELFLWWHDLPGSAKRAYNNGCEVLTPSLLPWDAFRAWKDLEQRVYRPFNPDTMKWEDYKQTSDYLVYAHHQHKQWFELLEVEEKARKVLIDHGLSLAQTMNATEAAKSRYCEGCEFNHPSQRRHTCFDDSSEE